MINTMIPAGFYRCSFHFVHAVALLSRPRRVSGPAEQSSDLDSVQPRQELTSLVQVDGKMQLQEKWLQSPHR